MDGYFTRKNAAAFRDVFYEILKIAFGSRPHSEILRRNTDRSDEWRELPDVLQDSRHARLYVAALTCKKPYFCSAMSEPTIDARAIAATHRKLLAIYQDDRILAVSFRAHLFHLLEIDDGGTMNA